MNNIKKELWDFEGHFLHLPDVRRILNLAQMYEYRSKMNAAYLFLKKKPSD